MFLSTLRDLVKFTIAYRKLWMLPFIFVLLVVGTLIVLTETSVIAPFIYALF